MTLFAADARGNTGYVAQISLLLARDGANDAHGRRADYLCFISSMRLGS
jgi:hypothetical protein